MPTLLAHAIFHIAMCGAVLRAAPATPVAIRLRLSDHHGVAGLERTFRVERGDDDSPKVVELDVPQGVYRLEVSTPQFNCNATDFLAFMPEQNRSISVTLAQGPAPATTPLLLEGTAPQAFLYAQPTFVLLDKNATGCNKPVGDPLPGTIVVENDQDSYYVSLSMDPAVAARGPVQLALRLKTPTHQYHYVRVPVPFPMPWGGFPNNVRFDVTQDEVDDLASQPVDTLLCLRLWETKVYL